ncbi:MAG: AAA family ATPase [Candidatus Syntrophoarchaeum sp.]|nr:AAA family ATPase [Candidatus Syntrophoarchaeum sp.]
MKAKALPEVYDIFDPQEPLTGEKLREYYVNRESPVKRLSGILKTTKKPLKYLFVGSRGNGKSTELNKLSELVKEELFIVPFSIKDRLNLFDVEYADILLVIGAEIYDKVSEQIELSKELDEYLNSWSETVVERVDEKQKGIGLGAGFTAIVNLSGKIKTQVTTREITRDIIKPRMSDLIDAINKIIVDAEEKLGKQLLIIIDDLDKVNLEKAEELFYMHGAELTQPICKVIYTIPQPLLFSNKIRQIVLQYFDGHEVLGNIKVHDKNSNLNSESCEVMKDVALRRMSEDLITEEALVTAIEFSGGILTEFMRIIKDAANIANTEGRERIENEDVEHAITEIRNDYIRILSKEDLEILKGVSKTKEKTDGESFQDLLFSLAILEYSNGEIWYDIHPTIKRVIE